MQKKWMASLGILFLTAALWGCGSNGGSGGDSTSGGQNPVDPDTGISFAMASECIRCHQGFGWSADKVAGYLEGKHVIHSDNITAASGAECLACHDPIGDGPGVAAFIDPADVPAEGLAAVGCENCHGPGGQHFGVGPMPVPKPDYTVCGKCHAALPTDHLRFHPEADNIVTDYEGSGHRAGSLRNSNVCVKCHNDEGAKEYLNIDDTDRLFILAIPVATASPIQCRTCHDPHNAGELLEAAITSGGSAASAEYRTCSNCHQPHNATVGTTLVKPPGSTSSDGGSADGQLIYHAARFERVITDTHYDDPTTIDKIEGYAMNRRNEHVCRDCHNVHSGELAINRQWAGSAHGGEILEAKEAAAELAAEDTIAQLAAVKAAGATDATAPGWVHYDWDASNRQDCQRCHTATGAMNFMKGPSTYNPANNDFSHLVGWSKNATTGVITSSGQNEMLYCWACHANNSGALRTPGAITEIYEGTPANPLVKVEYPDVAGSNVCMSCHLGRETGAVVKTKTGFDNLSFVNSHYLAAGGSVFGQTGYTYGDRNYAIPASDTHVMIGWGTTGNAVVDANFNNGPCVSCHFNSNDGSHTLSPLTEYAPGDVSLNPVCVNCHPTRGAGSNAETTWLGTDAIAATLQGTTHKARYQAALEALKVQLAADGFVFTPNHPYFANKNWLSPGDIDTTGNVTGKNNMGAAFNYNLLIHEPGGVAHNRRYTRRLIYDSIDWLDDGNLNYSVSATLNALNPEPVYKASAYAYLINAGTNNVNLGTAAERF
jgi:hypothetical protein